MSWAIAISVAAFLMGFGKFIDDYHSSPGSAIRARLQDILVKMFLGLERVRIPDIPLFASRVMFASKYRFTPPRLIGMTLGYYSIVLVVYLGFTTLIHRPVMRSQIEGSIQLSSLATILFIGISLPMGRAAVRFLDRQPQITQRILTPLLVIVMALVVLFVLGVISFFWDFLSSGRFPHRSLPDLRLNNHEVTLSQEIFFISLTLFAISGLVEPTLLILFIVAAAGLVLTSALIARLILMAAFDRASDPKKSPFAYFFALLGVVLLFVKMLQDVF